jgi:citrate synthase
MEWKTAVTHIEPNRISVRGYPVDRLMGRISFPSAIYLVLRGELPEPPVGEIIDAILVSSIDHGTTPPSCLAARNIATGGAPLNAAVAGGILAISRYHGGAIKSCLDAIEEGLDRMEEGDEDAESAAFEVVRGRREKGLRIAGFGHRIHTDDPRTARLLEMAGERNLSGRHIEMALALGRAIERSVGRRLPLNIDGAIAAVLGGLGFTPALANSFFLMARVPGLIAHAYEETERFRPVRSINPSESVYEGPLDLTPGGEE